MWKLTNTWKLHNTHLNNYWVKEKNQKGNQKKYLGTNKKKEKKKTQHKIDGIQQKQYEDGNLW